MTHPSPKGKIALVTGSARRVGRAIALALAHEGMHLCIHYATASSADEAESVAELIRAEGVRAITVQADQSKPAEVDRLFDRIRQEYGRLDLLVNSASLFFKGDLLSVSYEDWQRVMDINLNGVFYCSQHAVRLMKERTGDASGGSIINITDLSAFTPWKGFPAQSVSKAALKMLTEMFALASAPEVRVNAIAPGPVLRDEGNSPEQWEAIGKRLPVQHTGDPSDVAEAVIFLATQSFITGETLIVDGGEHLLS